MTLDQEIFYFIHHDLANPFLDTVLPYWREKTTWIPAYLIAAYFLWRKYRLDGLKLLILVAIAITISDQLTSSLIKPWVGRPRPCYTPLFEGQLRELVGCGGHDSFPSSHAANHFALAVLLALTWLRQKPGWIWAVMLWAASISLAQVYVAKHYPLDILVGGLLGAAVAATVVWLADHFKWLPRSRFVNQPIIESEDSDSQSS